MEEVKRYIDTKKLAYSMLFAIGALVLPQVFHLAGWVGPTFLPMHIPVILAGFILGKKYGLITGITAPIISTVITGMPIAFPMLPIMVLELGTYGFVAGFLAKETKIPILGALLIAMIMGRVAYAGGFYGLQILLGVEITKNISPISAVITGIPGIIIQILAIPILIKILKTKREA